MEGNNTLTDLPKIFENMIIYRIVHIFSKEFY